VVDKALIETVIDGLLPVAFAIALGWFAGARRIIRPELVTDLAQYVLKFGLPLALFGGALKAKPEQLTNVHFFLALTVGLMGSYLIALLLGRTLFKHDLRTATLQALTAGFPDMAYFGAPVLVALAGPTGYIAVVVGNLVTSLMMIPLTVFLLSMGQEKRGVGGPTPTQAVLSSLKHAITNPLVWLPILGAALTLSHVALAKPLVDSTDLIGRSAGGVSLFTLGLMFSKYKIRLNAEAFANIGMANVMRPVITFAAATAFGLHGLPYQEAVITGAVPTATAVSMFAIRENTYEGTATATVLAGTLIGIATVAIAIVFVGR